MFCSFIAPEAGPRAQVQATHDAGNLVFTETYISTPIEVCEERDPKGLYKKARAGIIPNFTGVSADYDVPTGDNVFNLNTENRTLDECVQLMVNDMIKKGIVREAGKRPISDSLVKIDTAKVAAAASMPRLELDTMQAEFL